MIQKSHIFLQLIRTNQDSSWDHIFIPTMEKFQEKVSNSLINYCLFHKPEKNFFPFFLMDVSRPTIISKFQKFKKKEIFHLIFISELPLKKKIVPIILCQCSMLLSLLQFNVNQKISTIDSLDRKSFKKATCCFCFFWALGNHYSMLIRRAERNEKKSLEISKKIK